MRYHVKSPEGSELVCPTLANLHALYDQGFLSDDDLVRPESSERWVKMENMPAMRGVRERRRDPRKMFFLLIAAMALVLALFLWARL